MFALLALAAVSCATIQTVINPVLPTIQRELSTTQATVTWLATGYLVASAALTPIVGKMGDSWGKERVLSIVLVIFACGCLVAALAPTIEVLIVARVVQGIGGAIFPLSFGIIRDELPASRVPGAVGTLAALLAVGGGLGVVVAGPLVRFLGYEWIFLLPMLGALVVAAAIKRVVTPRVVETTQTVNLLSAVLLAAWLVALLVPVSNAARWGWTDARTVVPLGFAAVLVVLWIITELRIGDPLVDMRLMRVRTIWVVNAVSALFGGCLFISVVFLPQFFQAPHSTGYGFGASMTETGFLLLPLLGAMFLSGLVSGRMQRLIGARRQLIASSSLMSVAGFILLIAHERAWELCLAQTLIGVSVASAFAASGGLIVASVPSERSALASGVNVNFRTIGGAIGVSAVSTLVAGHISNGAYPTEANYSRGFAVVAVLAMVATVMSTFCLPRHGGRRRLR